MLNDKAFQEAAPEAAAAEALEGGEEGVAISTESEPAPVEEVDLEAALGGGIRKAPAVAALLEEDEVAAESAK
jgi:small subunit ribosomal protein S2